MDTMPPGAFEPRPIPEEYADAYFAQQATFERNRLRTVTRQRNGLAVLCGTLGIAVGCMAVSFTALVPLVRFKPMVFVMDKTTGVVDRNVDIEDGVVSEAEALNRAYADNYVANRERYSADLLPSMSRQVSLLSSSDEAKRYNDWLKTSEDSPVKQIARKGIVGVREISTTLLSDPSEQSKQGTIQVRFQRIVTMENEPPKKTSWVATMHFERIKGPIPESILKENPIGWVVTAYDARQETTQ